MYKKTLILYAVYLLCCVQSVIAQASLKCYEPLKTRHPASWTVGIRTGIGEKHTDEYFDIRLFKELNWIQQFFIQHNISRHFMLELHITHQNTKQDMLPFTSYPGRVYLQALRKSQHLHTNLVFHYMFPEIIERLRSGFGIGAGVIANREKLKETYTVSGKLTDRESTNATLDVPNIYFGLTLSYLLKNNLSLTSQYSYSGISGTQPDYSMLTVGLSYKL
jgi:hypothetical protein